MTAHPLRIEALDILIKLGTFQKLVQCDIQPRSQPIDYAARVVLRRSRTFARISAILTILFNIINSVY